MLFLKSPAIVLTICRIASATNPSVSFCGCSELTVSTRYEILIEIYALHAH